MQLAGEASAQGLAEIIQPFVGPESGRVGLVSKRRIR
jgi:hypothetical protein